MSRLTRISMNIDGCSKAFHLAYYFPVNSSEHDTMSEEVLNFKRGYEKSVNKWCILSNFACKDLGITHIIRALGSNEICWTDGKPLDALGHFLAKELNAKYVPSFLAKTCQTVALKTLNKTERRNQVNSYFIADSHLIANGSTILVIDDVCTTGSTLQKIASLINSNISSSNIISYSLAHTHNSKFNSNIKATNDEILIAYNQASGTITKPASNAGQRPTHPSAPLPRPATPGTTKPSPSRSSYSQQQKPTAESSSKTITSYSSTTKSEGCFIATAIYGSYDHENVLLLRAFRDEILQKSIFGRALICLYYKTSPHITSFLLYFHILPSKSVKSIFDFLINLINNNQRRKIR